jgi:tetratricopeptide (TPR) repeat protein
MEHQPYTHLTDADYDHKLREMGNYLWTLEQDLLGAAARQDETLANQLEQKISSLVATADRFFAISGNHQSLAAYVAGLGLRIIGNWTGAADRFLRVLELSPRNGEAWLELSWCLAEAGNWQECELAARKGAEFFPETGAVWGNLAIALDNLGRSEEALSAAQAALRLDAQDTRSKALVDRLSGKDAPPDGDPAPNPAR